MNKTRIRGVNSIKYSSGPVAYWMSRDQRINDNWALIAAMSIAEANNTYVVIVFNLVPTFLAATIRQYGFMVKGLQEVEKASLEYAIPFKIVLGDPSETILEFVNQYKIGAVVTDFFPLNAHKDWNQNVSKQLSIPFYEVDSHNIVPAWIASPKQEFAAYTLRPKLRKLWPVYWEEFPQLTKQNFAELPQFKNNWQTITDSLQVRTDIPEVTWIQPGETAATKVLEEFLQQRLNGYSDQRNIPGKSALSELSPYLHFGQISAQRVALSVKEFPATEADKESFLDELMVRKELSDNFCLYNDSYDSLDAAPEWAKKTIQIHRTDPREVTYTKEELETAKTHDDLWNAAQMEMVKRGKMHGYIRMYWAKKILEWTKTPEEALEITIYLNDTYSLDGRDPIGYANILWSIAGLHDRTWFDRPIFGTIRYMNYAGAKRKFNIPEYIDFVARLVP